MAVISKSLGIQIDVDALGRELIRCGLTKRELASRIGVTPQTVTSIFNGERAALSTLQSIAVALKNTPVIPGMDLLLGNSGATTDAA